MKAQMKTYYSNNVITTYVVCKKKKPICIHNLPISFYGNDNGEKS